MEHYYQGNKKKNNYKRIMQTISTNEITWKTKTNS